MNILHTPTPWISRDNGQTFMIEGAIESHPMGEARETVATTSWHKAKLGKAPSKRQSANAEHIVRACNAHNDLIAALRDAQACIRELLDLQLGDAARGCGPEAIRIEFAGRCCAISAAIGKAAGN